MRRVRVPAVRFAVALWLATILGSACGTNGSPAAAVSEIEAHVIGDSLRAIVRNAYDLSKGDVARRMLSVYPADGRVVSATGGRVTTTRDSLAQAVNAFWDGVGQFMVRPRWTWGEIQVDVLGRDAAVMTASYTVPHWTAEGAPHVIGGVWTAVWQRREGRWEITHEHLSDLPRAVAAAIESSMPVGQKPATADSAPQH